MKINLYIDGDGERGKILEILFEWKSFIVSFLLKSGKKTIRPIITLDWITHKSELNSFDR